MSREKEVLKSPQAFQDLKTKRIFQNSTTAARRTSKAHSHATAH
jgi:hypothetical protein